MITAIIPAEFERFITGQVATGDFHSTDEVVTEALRVFREQKLDALRQQIQTGIDELDRGDCFVIEDEAGHDAFFADIDAEVQKEIEAERSR